MDYLVKQILDKDPGAILTAQELGRLAGERIKPLTANEDEGVRQIALRCLNRSGGDGLAEVFASALSDESPSVRAAALNGLQNHSDAQTYARLLRVYETVSDSQHRKEIALLLADGEAANSNDLRRIYAREKDFEAAEACLVALAKLGDRDSQVEFLRRLSGARGGALKRFLEYVEYLGQTWALRGLASVLSDKTPLVGTGFCVAGVGANHLARDFPEYLRACDWAVNLIAEIAEAKFPFPVGGAKNYDDAELAAARAILTALSSR